MRQWESQGLRRSDRRTAVRWASECDRWLEYRSRYCARSWKAPRCRPMEPPSDHVSFRTCKTQSTWPALVADLGTLQSLLLWCMCIVCIETKTPTTPLSAAMLQIGSLTSREPTFPVQKTWENLPGSSISRNFWGTWLALWGIWKSPTIRISC